LKRYTERILYIISFLWHINKFLKNCLLTETKSNDHLQVKSFFIGYELWPLYSWTTTRIGVKHQSIIQTNMMMRFYFYQILTDFNKFSINFITTVVFTYSLMHIFRINKTKYTNIPILLSQWDINKQLLMLMAITL
jgi:hypothetical protein